MEMKLLFERMSSFKAEKMLEMVSVTSLYNLYRQPDSPALAVMFQGLRVYETERGCGKAYWLEASAWTMQTKENNYQTPQSVLQNCIILE